jgi:Galactose oxidase, central domain
MSVLARRLGISGSFRTLYSFCVYSFVIGALAVVLPPRASAQAEDGKRPNRSREFAAIAHNTATHQFILFGGVNNGPEGGGQGPFFNDTWVWSAGVWEKETPATRPEPRDHAAMAYDSARGEVVLFGGNDSQSRRTVNTPWALMRTYPPSPLPRKGTDVFYRDTWVWNGTDWAQRNPAQAPSERFGHAMAYDAARKQVVLFGGSGGAGETLNDTWVWDGTNWKKMNPVNIPPARTFATLAYDPNHHQIVMFGGMDVKGSAKGHYVFGDTWLWDGSNWTRAKPTGDLPEARDGAGMDYDRSHGRLVLFSGYVYNSMGTGSPSFDSWTWNGSHWTKLDPSEYRLLYDAPEYDPLAPEDADRSLIANVGTPIIWTPKPAQ